jgi:2-(1,2-epoxy-1,2-dihydrophenyl)acetyl-CoA isomerase
VLLEASADPNVRVVVIRGAGGNFCAGGDVNEMGAGSDSSAGRMLRGRRLIEAMAASAKPILAGVQGYAVGAGLSLALAADSLLASADARFSFSFVQRALAPDMAAAYYLARCVGLQRARELIFSGRAFGAQEALSYGMVTEICPSDEFEGRLDGMAEMFAAGPTRSIGATRRLLARAYESDLATMLDLEAAIQPSLAATADHVESVAAFREKRPPHFRGD